MKSFATALLIALGAAASSDGAALRVEARTPQAVIDGDAVVFSFELAALSAVPLTVRAVEYSVAIEGAPLFSGSAQGFALPAGAEKGTLVAGFGTPARSRAVMAKMAGKERFGFVVRGTVRATGAEGTALDLPFLASGTAATPEDLAAPKPKQPLGHSLLAY